MLAKIPLITTQMATSTISDVSIGWPAMSTKMTPSFIWANKALKPSLAFQTASIFALF